MTVVIGTAGHIDHGKTTLLRALTGIDADRLPEERRRGLTIDVGYAHGAPDDGPAVDYVDVPGHDRLVGNMLVGVGEIDACLLVVAADDGPRAQTIEHLGLLDAMGLRDGVVAVTKADLVDEPRVDEVVELMRVLVGTTTLAGAPIVAVSAASGAGLDELRRAIARLRDRMERDIALRRRDAPCLAIDRVFPVRGRGLVATGSSRGRALVLGEALTLIPGGSRLRVRGLHVHDAAVAKGPEGGRVALQLAGADAAQLRRGQVLTAAEATRGLSPTTATARLLVALRPPAALGSPAARPSPPAPTSPPAHASPAGLTPAAPTSPWPPRSGLTVRLHIGTDQADAVLGRSGRDAVMLPDGRAIAVLRLDREVAAAAGWSFVLRRPPPAGLLAGGTVLDVEPPRGRSRQRQTPAALSRLVSAVEMGDERDIEQARLALHGLLGAGRDVRPAPDVEAVAREAVLRAVAAHHLDHPEQAGPSLPPVRGATAAAIRRSVTVAPADAMRAADLAIERLLASGALVRAGQGVRLPDHQPAGPDPERSAAMDRLVAALDRPAPPSLEEALAASGCPWDALRELEAEARIVVANDDLAWSAAAYLQLRETALRLAGAAPLTPAALRDATGTSRKVVMALLEDLGRRGILKRTAAGHVPGPRARAES